MIIGDERGANGGKHRGEHTCDGGHNRRTAIHWARAMRGIFPALPNSRPFLGSLEATERKDQRDGELWLTIDSSNKNTVRTNFRQGH